MSASDPPEAAPAGAPSSDPTLAIPVRVELAPEAPPLPGADLRQAAGRYLIEAEIGRGAAGSVYRAFDRDLRRHVAMKMMLRDVEAGTLAARFVEEAQAVAQLQHPGIVPIYEIGRTSEGKLFFTMKLARGRTLDRAIPQLTRFRLLVAFVAVARTVAYAHERGVIHRDLKPQNVMLGDHGEVQVMDWGVARVVRGVGAEPVQGCVVGTPTYMPPEEVAGREVGAFADVYALGAILYQILTGRPPYDGVIPHEVFARVLAGDPPAAPRSIDPSVPPALEAIVRRAMAHAPEDRHASAAALADDVQAWLEDPASSAGGPRRRTIAAAAIALTIALAVGLPIGTALAPDDRAATIVRPEDARPEVLPGTVLSAPTPTAEPAARRRGPPTLH